MKSGWLLSCICLLSIGASTNAQRSPFNLVFPEAFASALTDSRGDLITVTGTGATVKVRKIVKGGTLSWTKAIPGTVSLTNIFIRPDGTLVLFGTSGAGSRQIELNSFSGAITLDSSHAVQGAFSIKNILVKQTTVPTPGGGWDTQALTAYDSVTGQELWTKAFYEVFFDWDNSEYHERYDRIVWTFNKNGDISVAGYVNDDTSTSEGFPPSVCTYHTINATTGAVIVKRTVEGSGEKSAVLDLGNLFDGRQIFEHRHRTTAQFLWASDVNGDTLETNWPRTDGFLDLQNQGGFLTGRVRTGVNELRGLLFGPDGNLIRMLPKNSRAVGRNNDPQSGYLYSFTDRDASNHDVSGLGLILNGVENQAAFPPIAGSFPLKDGYMVATLNGQANYMKVNHVLQVTKSFTEPNLTGLTSPSAQYFVPTGVQGEAWSVTGYNGGHTISLRTVHPIGRKDTYTINEDQTLTVAAPGLLANDISGEGNTIYSQITGWPNDTQSFDITAYGSFKLVPKPNFNGNIDFYYRVKDAVLNEYYKDVQVHVVVKPVRDDPVAVNDNFTVNINTDTTFAAPGVLANDKNPDALQLTPKLVSQGTKGTGYLSPNGAFRFRAPSLPGDFYLKYKLVSGSYESPLAEIHVRVNNFVKPGN